MSACYIVQRAVYGNVFSTYVEFLSILAISILERYMGIAVVNL